MTGLKTQGRENRQDAIRFCTHCGVVTDDASQRVCPLCGLGVVLSCDRSVAPRPDAPFLVVTTDLRVSAASAAVEALFGDPDALVGLPMLDLLRGDGALPRQVARAAMGSTRSTTAWVRTAEHGRPHKARIAACGYPPAAIIVLS
jgi:ribosomal protein L37E